MPFDQKVIGWLFTFITHGLSSIRIIILEDKSPKDIFTYRCCSSKSVIDLVYDLVTKKNDSILQQMSLHSSIHWRVHWQATFWKINDKKEYLYLDTNLIRYCNDTITKAMRIKTNNLEFTQIKFQNGFVFQVKSLHDNIMCY